jgi:hypothetical protein
MTVWSGERLKRHTNKPGVLKRRTFLVSRSVFYCFSRQSVVQWSLRGEPRKRPGERRMQAMDQLYSPLVRANAIHLPMTVFHNEAKQPFVSRRGERVQWARIAPPSGILEHVSLSFTPPRNSTARPFAPRGRGEYQTGSCTLSANHVLALRFLKDTLPIIPNFYHFFSRTKIWLKIIELIEFISRGNNFSKTLFLHFSLVFLGMVVHLCDCTNEMLSILFDHTPALCLWAK